MRNLWLLSDVGLGIRGVSNYVLSYSVAQAFGGRIAAMLIGRFGRRTFTTLSNICCALSFGLWSFPKQCEPPYPPSPPFPNLPGCAAQPGAGCLRGHQHVPGLPPLHLHLPAPVPPG